MQERSPKFSTIIPNRINCLAKLPTKLAPDGCHNVARMRRSAQSRPPSDVQVAPATGRFEKSSFCNRSQAENNRKNTGSFPGFIGLEILVLWVPALDSDISQHQCALTLPAISARSSTQNRKNIKARNEVNLTQEKSGAANPAKPELPVIVVPASAALTRLSVLAQAITTPLRRRLTQATSTGENQL